MSEFTPIAYIKTNCPFSFKFRLFVTESGLTENFAFVELDVNAPSHTVDKANLKAMIGHAHTFPVVEVSAGEYIDDSDALISHFAGLHGVDHSQLATLNFYRNGLIPTFLEMFHILAMPLGWIARLGRKPMAFR